MGFEETTPIQTKSIPLILEGKDITAQAPTGTGKTCAFGAPVIDLINNESNDVQAIILCPTRELVIQTSKELQAMCKYKTSIRVLPIYGGQQIERQIIALKKRPQIIIGTPGRVIDHLRRRTLKLENIRTVVLDEADEMLNMGFREDLDVILQSVPAEKQFILFSATLPKEILDIADKYQNDPVRINVTHKQLTVPTVEQFYIEVTENSKVEVLSRIIDANNFKLCVIFCNTKKRVDELCENLLSRGYSVEALHGDMKQLQRDSVMSKFRNGMVEILVATDVAARGIDVDDVEAVFNFDIPSDEEYYVHRIGRTGRANRKGVSFTLAVGKEIYKLKEIQKYTKSKIKQMKPPSIEDIKDNKISSILQEIKDTVSEGNLDKYIEYIEKVTEELMSMKQDHYVTSLDIAAALLKLSLSKISMGASSDYQIEEIKNVKNKAGIRFFINIGKKDNIKTGSLIQLLKKNTSLQDSQINNIDILDKFSFFEVPKQYKDEVITALSGKMVKGRKINIEIASRTRKSK